MEHKRSTVGLAHYATENGQHSLIDLRLLLLQAGHERIDKATERLHEASLKWNNALLQKIEEARLDAAGRTLEEREQPCAVERYVPHDQRASDSLEYVRINIQSLRDDTRCEPRKSRRGVATKSRRVKATLRCTPSGSAGFRHWASRLVSVNVSDAGTKPNSACCVRGIDGEGEPCS